MRRSIQCLLVIAVVLDIVYWSLWFGDRNAVASEHTSGYYDFENAFPMADTWLALLCVAALIALARNARSACLWLAGAGSAGMYLFSMDFLYDIEHDIFSHGGAGAFEACIVSATLVFSLVALRYAARLNRVASS